MMERTLRFDGSRHLLGTFTDPSTVDRRAHLSFITFNAGTISRVGPNRINVALCRAMASLGVASLRFDLSGLGDSLPAPSSQPFEDQAINDLRAALDQMQRLYGADRAVVMGICSGAEHAYSLALTDPRVSGVILFDPYMYPTWRTHLNRYLRRLREHGPLRAAGGWLRRRSLPGQSGAAPTLWSDRAVPSRAEFAHGLAELVDRGVNVYLIYSGGRPDDYNYEGQFRDGFHRFGIVSKVRCDFLATVNHTIMEMSAQETVCRRVKDWAGCLAASQPTCSSHALESVAATPTP